MCAGTASGECTVRGNGRTMVGAGTGFYLGEVAGTGIIGGMLSYPIAYLIMGNKAAALFTFVVPFLISTCGGTIIAIIVTIPMKKAGILDGEIQRREKL